MAVDIPSDLVFDVMQAADPARLKQVVARLAPQPHDGIAPAASFAGVLADAGASPPEHAGATPPAALAADETVARQGFEQLVWRNLYEVMLPAENSGVYGEGIGADVWRSMAADQLAAVSATSGRSELIPGLEHRVTGAAADVPLQAAAGWPYFVTGAIRSYAG